MPASPDDTSMALFCDFENVALGVADAKYDKFDIRKVLERLLLKGSIVVKKAYCDWDRYKAFKAAMHEASFELIEIPHVRQAGKNSADIRLVVDALDLCYTKSHVDTFVIISGDSDFSPLVSKLRENAKTVIGVGVKNSSSDLLIANCDEFIFYDDLVRAERGKSAARRPAEPARRTAEAARRPADPAKATRRRTARTPKADNGEGKAAPVTEAPSEPVADAGAEAFAESATSAAPADERADDDRRTRAIEQVVETLEALAAERGDADTVWGSMIKQALRRRQPGFNESYYGFRSFNALLEEAQARGMLTLTQDEKSGGYKVRPVLSVD